MAIKKNISLFHHSWNFLISLMLTPFIVSAQTYLVVPDTVKAAFSTAISTYHESRGEYLRLYNGPEFIPHLPANKGFAFFDSPAMASGVVCYENVVYKDVSLMYDLVRDELIIRHPANFRLIVLQTPKVKYFTQAGHTFINGLYKTIAELQTGYYDQLVTGKITILAKRKKTQQEFFEGNNINRRFDYSVTYLAENKGVISTVRSRKSLMKLFGGRRDEVQKYLNKNKIRFRKNREESIIQITRYFNQLN